jgi:hypothetical protein
MVLRSDDSGTEAEPALRRFTHRRPDRNPRCRRCGGGITPMRAAEFDLLCVSCSLTPPLFDTSQ